MKKVFFALALFFSLQVFSQTIAFDFALIDAENIGAYDQNLTNRVVVEKFIFLNKE